MCLRGMLHELAFLSKAFPVAGLYEKSTVCIAFDRTLGIGVGLKDCTSGSGLVWGGSGCLDKAKALGPGSGETFWIAVGEQDTLSGIGTELPCLRLATIFLSRSGLSFVPIMHFMQLDVIPNRPEVFTVTQVKTPCFSNESCNFSLLALLRGSLIPILLHNGLALGLGWTNLTLPVPSSGWSCPLVPCSHGRADAAVSPLGWAAGPSSDSRSELAPSEL